jgi:hypothetical protein
LYPIMCDTMCSRLRENLIGINVMCINDRRRRRRVVGTSFLRDLYTPATRHRRLAMPRGFTTYLELPNITSQDTLANSMLPEKHVVSNRVARGQS